MRNEFNKEEARLDLEQANKKLLKASVLRNVYAIKFGREYAESTTRYTRKMLDDDLDALKRLEAELDE